MSKFLTFALLNNAQDLPLFRFRPPSVEEVELMEICLKAQEHYTFEIAIPVAFDDSLNAFWDAEAAKSSNEEDTTTGSSKPLRIEGVETSQAGQGADSATESDDALTSKFVRKPQS